MRVKDQRRRASGRLGAVLALCVSMARLWPAGALAAPHAKGALAPPDGVVAGGPVVTGLLPLLGTVAA